MSLELWPPFGGVRGPPSVQRLTDVGFSLALGRVRGAHIQSRRRHDAMWARLVGYRDIQGRANHRPPL